MHTMQIGQSFAIPRKIPCTYFYCTLRQERLGKCENEKATSTYCYPFPPSSFSTQSIVSRQTPDRQERKPLKKSISSFDTVQPEKKEMWLLFQIRGRSGPRHIDLKHAVKRYAEKYASGFARKIHTFSTPSTE